MCKNRTIRIKSFLLCILVLFLNLPLRSQELEPIGITLGKLSISIDPRIELLSTVQVLSGYPLVNSGSAYSKEIREYFHSFVSHPAVIYTDSLYKAGFSYDAPPSFMLQLSGVPDLHLKTDNPEYTYVSHRAGGTDKLITYRNDLQQFALTSSFDEFWKSKSDYYRQIVETTTREMGRKDLVEWIENYYNETQHSYHIILSPLFDKQNYGPKITQPDGKAAVYSCNGLTRYKNDIPYIDSLQTRYLVLHEFSHSFVNPNTEKHLEQVNRYDHLFAPIQEWMARIAYNTWQTCVNEHVVRAVVIRLTELHVGKEEAHKLVSHELQNNFVYIEPILQKLKEFEVKRDEEKIAFSDFFPEILEAFDGLQPREKVFSGPINGMYSIPGKMALIYPTQIQDSLDYISIKNYLDKVSGLIASAVPHMELIPLADTTALSVSLEEYGLMVYGNPENNAWLSSQVQHFPFSIENHQLKADRLYPESDVKIITCLPNPQNPQKGMIIYCALTNQNLIGINSVHHGGEDYVIFTDREHVLTRGSYQKNGKWKF